MRLLTYNIHGWRTAVGEPNLDAVAQLIAATQADIVGLNEVFYPRVVAGSDQPALEALAKKLGMHFVFGPCLRWPAQNEMPATAYGNALLSRWPIIASSAHHLTAKEEDSQNLLAAKEQRGMLEGRILLPDGHTLTVYVIHLDHTDEEARLIQLRVARTWLQRDRRRPHVVMGDFNAITPWDFQGRDADWATMTQHPKGVNLAAAPKGPRVITQMEKAGYVDVFQHFNQPGERSYLGSDYPIRIDYIFANEPLAPQVQSCQLWTTPSGEPSDHRPVLAEIETAPN